MESTERVVETVTQVIYRSFFDLSNLHDTTSPDDSEKSLKVPDSKIFSADFTYFTFCSQASAATVDCRADTKSLALDFFPPLTLIPYQFRYQDRHEFVLS